MNQQYVVVWNEPYNPAFPDPMAQLAELVPEAKVIEKRENLYLLECPISCEADLFDYFSADDAVISRKHTYHLSAGESDRSGNES